MKVVLSPEFLSRLDNLEHYVTNELSSPKAASDLVNEILEDCSLLELFPMVGRRVVSQDNREAIFRMILVRHFMIIYDVVNDDIVRIVNIIDAHSNESSGIVKL